MKKYPEEIMIGLMILLLAVWMFYPRQYTDADYVKAIVGEASNQTEDTMICVAHALRNRGTLEGVYGYNALHVKSESRQTFRRAIIAWDLSKFEPDNVKRAKSFGTLDDLIDLGIERNQVKARCGDFYFY